MSHVSLYRKYRPQNFDQVLGQEPIVATLQSALKSGKLSHAYLFAGSRGTGKTSIARIFARELGVSPNDIYEIDAASNRGIGEMKELLSGIASLPFDSKYKVYILDEVHMFTKEAWNALLKTLEEPPKHVIFILATTELHKVLDTVRSRCQVFEFKKPTIETLKKMIIDGAKSEGFDLDENAAEMIASHSDGAFRDAWGVLERVSAAAVKGKSITSDIVRTVLATPHRALITQWIATLASRDIDASIAIINQVRDEGHSLEHFLEQAIAQCRMILLYRFAPQFAETVANDWDEASRTSVRDWAKNAPHMNAGMLVELLHVLDEMKKTTMPEIALELAIMRILGQNSAA